MSETYRLTRVEELNRDHPGLQEFVDEHMAGGFPLSQLSELVQEKFGVRLATSTLHSYWQRRYNPSEIEQRKIYRQVKAEVDVLMQETSADPASDSAKILAAYLKSAIFRQKANLDQADVMKLLAEERKRTELEQHQQEIELERQRLEHDKKTLELKVQQLEKQQENAKEEIEQAGQKLGKGESLTIDDINRIRERVFGLPPEAPASTAD